MHANALVSHHFGAVQFRQPVLFALAASARSHAA
jgi:hypothetical protein